MLEDLITKSTAKSKDPRKTKSAKSGKSRKGKGKKSKGKKKQKAPAVSYEQLKSPAAMTNAYYICHNPSDFLFVRGFKFKARTVWETTPDIYRRKILGYR